MMSSKPSSNNSFLYSRLWGVVANALSITSGIVSLQPIRVVASGLNMLGNFLGIKTSYLRMEHEKSPRNISPTAEDIAKPLTWADFEKWLGTNLEARNWVSHCPRVAGNVTGIVSGYYYNRGGEATAGLLFAVINAIPLIKSDKAYKVSGAAGLIASAALIYSGYKAKDGWQLANGMANFSYYLLHMNVPNPVSTEPKGDQLFTAKIKNRLGSSERTR